MPDKMSDEKEICFEPMALKYHHSYGSTADDERSYYKVSDRLAKEIKEHTNLISIIIPQILKHIINYRTRDMESNRRKDNSLCLRHGNRRDYYWGRKYLKRKSKNSDIGVIRWDQSIQSTKIGKIQKYLKRIK